MRSTFQLDEHPTYSQNLILSDFRLFLKLKEHIFGKIFLSDEEMVDTVRRPSGYDEDHLNTLFHNNPRQFTRYLANVMNCDHSTIVRHLHSKGQD